MKSRPVLRKPGDFLHISVHTPYRDFSGGKGFLGAVGQFHHKAEIIVHGQRPGLLAGDGGDELHLLAHRQTVGAVAVQIFLLIAREPGVHPVEGF